MLNWLWGGMILIGVIYGAFNGRMADITNVALDSSREAVSLCITMMGVMSLWMGLMKIAESAGIIKGLSARMKPILRFLFPEVPDDHPAQKHMAVNMIANVLGLGWAATPAGLRAMEELRELNKQSCKRYGGSAAVASNAMCSFPHFKYLFAPVDPGKCHSLSESVRQCESGRNYRGGNCGNGCEYGDRDIVL